MFSCFSQLDNSSKKGENPLVEKDLFRIIMAQQLKIIRLEMGKKQHKMDELADLPEKYFGKLERDEKFPDSYTLFKIYRGLNISIDRLFNEINAELKEHKDDE